MGLLRDLCVSIAACLFILPVVWPVPAAPPELMAAIDVTGSTLHELETGSNYQPTKLSVITLVNYRPVRRKGHQVADTALLAAVEVGTPEEMAQAAPLKPPAPTLFADINLTTQRLTVSDKSGVLYKWKISSARSGYVTPVGAYKAQWTSRMHYSRQYYNSPMPYSVFFHRGYAIHGTSAVGRLGRPASHGCVRLRTSNAKEFYNLVHKHGKELTKIAVRGTSPASASRKARDYRPRRRYRARKRARRRTYQPVGLFSAYSYRQPRRRRYRRRRYNRY
jgi:lipoprotein-anchoring transpeptidase ErfK/SrfK